MRERTIRMALIIVDLFAAVSAIVGAVGLLIGYMNIPLSVLHGTPFSNFTVPALLLGIVVGGSALAAAAITLAEPRRRAPLKIAMLAIGGLGPLASALAGCIMVGWMTVEIALIGLSIWVQAAYLAAGLLMIGLAVLLLRAESQQSESRRTGATGLRHAA